MSDSDDLRKVTKKGGRPPGPSVALTGESARVWEQIRLAHPGVTITEAARLLGVRPETLSDWLRGTLTPYARDVIRAAGFKCE